MRTSRLVAGVLLCAIAVTVILAGCGGGGGSPYGNTGTTTPNNTAAPSQDASSGAATVKEEGFAFSPATLEVAVGDTVTFTNSDSSPHNVAIDGTELGAQAQGESVTWKATKAGTFDYSCTIHPAMTGNIVVK